MQGAAEKEGSLTLMYRAKIERVVWHGKFFTSSSIFHIEMHFIRKR